MVPAVLSLMATACVDQLNLQPAQSISEEIALENEDNVKKVLIGAYDAISDGDLYGGNMLRNAELLGGDGEIRWVGTFNAPREIFNKQIPITNGDVDACWGDAYRVINVANNALSALDKVNATDRPVVEGEALFLRSAMFFELVRFFAPQYEAGQAASQPGVPLILSPTRGINDESFVSRSTVEQVYNQVIADLTKAEAQLPAQNPNSASFRATKGAAAAMLARVYLQKGDFANARDAASRVIESNQYSLLGAYEDVFNKSANTSETIFAIDVTIQDGINNMNLFYSIPAFGGRDGDIDILPGHLSLYDTTDARYALFFEGAGEMRTGKWNNQFGDVGIIRLAEMYLIRAECNQRLNSAVGDTPLNDYNMTRTRAGLAAATDVTLADILLERRLELAHEGFRIHDQRRNRENVGQRPYNDNLLVFPIPQREIVVNKNLTQNAGY